MDNLDRPAPGPLDDYQELVESFAALGRRLAASADTDAALATLTQLAVVVVAGARWVSITRGLEHRFVTMAASDQVAAAADDVQYRLGTGPCLDAVTDEAVFASDDLRTEDRWSSFGPTVSRDLGIHSVMSMRLTIDHDDEHGLNASLNLYADHAAAFDDAQQHLAVLLATHAAVAVSAVVHRDNARHLAGALDSNREIGVAMGVLMTTYRLTRTQAFDLLRLASQNTNRKLRDIATEVADTGTLDYHPRSRRRPGHFT